MLQLAATLITLAGSTLTGARTRWRALEGEADRGSVTLEQVLMSLGLFLAALAVVATITAAVNSRLAQIT